MYCRCAAVYKIFRLLITWCHKNLSCKFVQVMQKCYVSVNICDNRNGIKPCNFFTKFSGLYIVDGMCASMFKFFSVLLDGATAPTTTFQTADLRIFSARIVVIFWTTCIDREECSIVVKCNRSCRYCSASKEALLLFLVFFVTGRPIITARPIIAKYTSKY